MGDDTVENSEFKFRTAAFGGFQKQDVLNYLELSAKEHIEKLAALQKELDEVKKAKAEAEEKLTEQEQRIRDLTEENQHLMAETAQRETERAQAAAERDAKSAEAEELRKRVEKLEPSATAYETIKDRAAGIELEAHSRALNIEGEARRKSKKLTEQMGEWLKKFQAGYDRLRTELDGDLTQALEQLHQTEKELGKISQDFAGHDEAFRALKEQLEVLNGPKAPEPLPTEEK